VNPTARRPTRRYRLRPLRLVAALLLLGALCYLVFVAPRQLWFALGMPGPSPLTAQGVPRFREIAAAQSGGRCLALHVDSNGTATAAITDGTGLTLRLLAADGTSAAIHARVPAEPVAAAFFGDQGLAVWCVGSGQEGGSLVGFLRPTEPATRTTPLGTAWRLDTVLHRAAIYPLANAVAVIGAGSDGIPAECLVLGPTGRVLYREALLGGLFTAWSAAIPGGGLTLGGATFTDSGMQPFVKHIGADYRELFSAATAGGPPLSLSASPTGKYVLAVSPRAVSLWSSDGTVSYERGIAGARIAHVQVLGDGTALLGSVETTLALNPRGRVTRRWRAAGPGPIDPSSTADLAGLSLPGGAAIFSTGGASHGLALWEGPSELVAIDSSGRWLARATGNALTVWHLEERASPH